MHRDVKPSNLLLDHHGKLWITDFGLARVQNSPGVTMTGDIVGTLRYMSPEQASGDRGMVDARTDVYALGATLYETLTLRPAFPGDDRREVVAAIEGREPTSLRKIDPEIPLDLETIVLKAMSKSSPERYLTAGAMAEDLRRFLEGKPTLARRPTLLDRSAKWLWRHRKLATAAAFVMVLLALCTTAGALLLARESAEKRSAYVDSQRHLQRAQEHFQQARQAVDRFGIQFADQLQNTPGTEPVRQQFLLEALAFYQEFAKQIRSADGLQDQLAATLIKSGVVTAKLGASQSAIDDYRSAQRVLRELIERRPDDPQLRMQMALSRNNTALLLAEQGLTEAALDEVRQAIATQERLVANYPDDPRFASQLAESHLNLGTLLGRGGRGEQGLQSLQDAVLRLESLYDASPNNAKLARSLAIAYNNVSFLQRPVDRRKAAGAVRKAITILQDAGDRSPVTNDCLADLALCHANLAAILSDEQHANEAIVSYRQAIAIRESLVRKSPGVVRYRSELASSLNNLALLEIQRDALPEAAEAFASANRL
ncbi:MAG: serine/threonine-protein kinase, partial [Planctomycetota bacterium]